MPSSDCAFAKGESRWKRRRRVRFRTDAVRSRTAPLPVDSAAPSAQIPPRWPDGGVVTQRTANPCTPVRFRLGPPTVAILALPSAKPTARRKKSAGHTWNSERSPVRLLGHALKKGELLSVEDREHQGPSVGPSGTQEALGRLGRSQPASGHERRRLVR